MSGRDIDAEFGRIVSTEFAAHDPELIAYYQNQMYGDGDEHFAGEKEFVHGVLRYEYFLSPSDLVRAVGKCVGKLAGIKTGGEFFNGKY